MPEAGDLREICGDLTGFQKEQAGEQFDYIVMAGSLKPDYEAQIAAAKALLKPEGELIVAVCNSLGMKYSAGPKDEHSFSRKAIKTLDRKRNRGGRTGVVLSDAGLQGSHEYLFSGISAGERRSDHTITAYDYPKYLQLDVGASFDTVFEDGQF